jgi:hypothetical protein
MIQQNPTNGLRTNSHEMRPILPLNAVLSDHAKVSFVNQSRRLERMSGSLPGELALGDPTQFIVHEGIQQIDGGSIAVAYKSEELRDFGGFRHGRSDVGFRVARPARFRKLTPRFRRG